MRNRITAECVSTSAVGGTAGSLDVLMTRSDREPAMPIQERDGARDWEPAK
ncbi:MAG: hypothetical protein GY720_14700 [bacterium]|nr:hypothetical protein [bacterium]